MAYEKHNYASGDVLLASELNEMDDAIGAHDIDIGDLKSTLNQATAPYGNLIDESNLLLASGWAENDGDYYGKAMSLHQKFYADDGYFPVSFDWEPKTRYCLVFTVKTDAVGYTNNGIGVYMRYTDNTEKHVTISRSTTDWVTYSITSDAGKTVSKIQIFLFNGGSDIWHIKEMTLAKGTNRPVYKPYELSSKDKEARDYTSYAVAAIMSEPVPFEFSPGNLAETGEMVGSQKYAYTEAFYYGEKGSIITFNNPTISLNGISIFYYTSDNPASFSGDKYDIPNALTDYTSKYVLPKRGWFRIRLKKSGNADITNADIYMLYQCISFQKNMRPVDQIEFTERFNLPSSWAARVSEIQKSQGKLFTFAVQTDPHFTLNSHFENDTYSRFYANDDGHISSLANLTHLMGFDFVCNLGDLVQGFGYETLEEDDAYLYEIIRRYVENIKCPLLITPGNHDDRCKCIDLTETGELRNTDEQFSMITMPCRSTIHKGLSSNRDPYFYVDFDEVRVIVLNTRDLPYNSLNSLDNLIDTHVVSDEQINWFNTSALYTSKPVIILSHVPLVSFSAGQIIPTNGNKILNALRDFILEGGSVIACLSGHVHEQKCKIETISASDENDNRGNVNVLHISFNRTGNINDHIVDCAEIVMVDFDNEIINTKIIGKTHGSKYSDRLFHTDIITVDSTVSLTPMLASVTSWISNDSEVATVDAGVVTAMGSGSTIITATNSDNNKEFWSIVV